MIAVGFHLNFQYKQETKERERAMLVLSSHA